MTTPRRTDVGTTLNAVTVYRDRAQLGYAATVSVGAGVHTFVMCGHAEWNEMDRDTVQVQLEDAQNTLAVMRNVGFVSRAVVEDTRERVVALRARREEVQDKLDDLEDRVSVAEMSATFAGEVESLLAKAGRGGERLSGGDAAALHGYLQDSAKWGAMAEFVAGTQRDSRVQVAEMLEEKKRLELELARVDEELREAGGDMSHGRCVRTRMENTLEATVEVSADAGATVELRFVVRFVVMGAQWTPLYDLRVDAAASKMEVSYYAQVSQRTGMNWENVRLRLSTAAPHFGGSPPSLGGRWGISLTPPRPRHMMRKRAGHVRLMAAPGAYVDMAECARSAPVAALVEEAMTSEGGSSSNASTFTIAGLSTVRCDNKPVKVTVARRTFTVMLSYACVPKLDPLTYLTAKVRNETDYELLPGKTNVFLDNTFVNNGRLELVQAGAEFGVSLGCDDAVKVTRKQIQRLEAKSKSLLTGTKRTVDYVYAFEVVCSQLPAPVEVVVRDQYPISQDKDMTVTLKEPSSADLKEDSGKEKMSVSVDDLSRVEWRLRMDPREKRHFRFAFRAVYPDDSEQYGLSA